MATENHNNHFQLFYFLTLCFQDLKIKELLTLLMRYNRVQDMVMSVQESIGELSISFFYSVCFDIAQIIWSSTLYSHCIFAKQ